MATHARLLPLIFLMTLQISAQAQTMPEYAATLTVVGERCGEAGLVSELKVRYADSREYLAELPFRREKEPPDPPAKSCAYFRQSARELRQFDARADAIPWPASIHAARADYGYLKVYAVRAGAEAARSWLCGFSELTDRLSAAYPNDPNFQQVFLATQARVLDGDRILNCEEAERRARRIIVTFQVLEVPRSPSPQPDRSRVQCLLPALRTTIPMSISDCRVRRGKAFETFTRVDEDYVPDINPK